MSLIELTPAGLFCPQGQFYIDPARGVERALVTHAHSDHARPGSASYLTSSDGKGLLQERLGPQTNVDSLDYGETLNINGVHVSVHPAGHVLGSCMIRLEYRGEIWVIGGDYKVHADPTCRSMQPIPCHVFITESTFALPIYRWRPPQETIADINDWWRTQHQAGRCCVLFAYSLGKSQRLLSQLDPTIGPIGVHSAVAKLIPHYVNAGIRFPPFETMDPTDEAQMARIRSGGIILAPSASAALWLHKFGEVATATTSGWMAIRNTRRRQNVDAAFVLSDHADWPGLLQTIHATRAERVGVTHGFVKPLVKYLREQGKDAFPLGLLILAGEPTPPTGEAG